MDEDSDSGENKTGKGGRRKAGAGSARRAAPEGKPAGGRKAAAAKPAKATPKLVTARTPPRGEQLRKKDFVDQVAAAAGTRKADVRKVVDAALALVAARVTAGDELILPPLGKLRLVKEKDNGKTRIAVLRLQLTTAEEEGATGASDPLAPDED
jgi:hypothetical protein